MKFLIVEDNVKIRAFIKKTLEQNLENIKAIYECDDGDEAIDLYKKYQPTWVLMNMHLKTVHGLTATRMIMDFDPIAKIIIVTQYDDPEYKEQAKVAGACGFVVKDNLFQMLKIIKDWSLPQRNLSY